MLRHDFQLENLGFRFSTDGLNNLFEPGINAANQHATSVLRAPYNFALLLSLNRHQKTGQSVKHSGCTTFLLIVLSLG